MSEWFYYILTPLGGIVVHLRWASYLLVLANCILWIGPLAWRSVFGKGPTPGWPNAQFAIPLLSLQLGVLGFQNGYLFEGLPTSNHGRNAINLGLIVVAQVAFLYIFVQRIRDARDLFDETHWTLRLKRRLKRVFVR